MVESPSIVLSLLVHCGRVKVLSNQRLIDQKCRKLVPVLARRNNVVEYFFASWGLPPSVIDVSKPIGGVGSIELGRLPSQRGKATFPAWRAISSCGTAGRAGLVCYENRGRPLLCRHLPAAPF